MKIKTIALAGLIGSTLLLTGCGGGGGGSNVQPTAIDGFNMTQGSADAKKSSTYLSEFLTEKDAQYTTVSDLYSRLDISGLESVHGSGWTGKGKTITVLDSDFGSSTGHGRYVSDIARVVAPGSSRNEFSPFDLINTDNWLITMNSEVVTTSIGYAPSAVESNGTLKSKLNDFIQDIESSDAVLTIASQHSNWSGTRDGVTGRGGFTNCPNSGSMTVADCNTWAAYNLDGGNVIYVGGG